MASPPDRAREYVRPHVDVESPSDAVHGNLGRQPGGRECGLHPGLDVWVCSQPYRGEARGGDVHYVSLCGGGVITRMIVADVSGHGEAVSEFSGSLRTLVRNNINRKSQTRLVARLNQQFSALAQLRRFATAVVATYLADRDRLSLCNAGHPRPFWYHAATREWEVLTSKPGGPAIPSGIGGAANLPLGLDDETPYDQIDVVLGRGDLIVIYTDALSEASTPLAKCWESLGCWHWSAIWTPPIPSGWVRPCSTGSPRIAPGCPRTMMSLSWSSTTTQGPFPGSQSLRNSTSIPRCSVSNGCEDTSTQPRTIRQHPSTSDIDPVF